MTKRILVNVKIVVKPLEIVGDWEQDMRDMVMNSNEWGIVIEVLDGKVTGCYKVRGYTSCCPELVGFPIAKVLQYFAIVRRSIRAQDAARKAEAYAKQCITKEQALFSTFKKVD